MTCILMGSHVACLLTQLQASANSSHGTFQTHFLPGTTSPYYELLIGVGCPPPNNVFAFRQHKFLANNIIV